MKISAKELRAGLEIDFGGYGQFGVNRYRLTLRWNGQTKEYEFIKHHYQTIGTRREHDDVVFKNADLCAIVKQAGEMASELSLAPFNDEVVP